MIFDEATDIYKRAIKVVDKRLGLAEAIKHVINNRQFQDGYGAKSHHHNFKGGLYIHTAEVLASCMSVTAPLNTDVLYVAAVWHDFMKIRDYKDTSDLDPQGGPQYTQHKHLIYHIAGSHAEWVSYAKLAGMPQGYQDAVSHCILAHHGRPEWGSTIQPQTPEAWTLHWADCMSAWFENGKYKEKT